MKDYNNFLTLFKYVLTSFNKFLPVFVNLVIYVVLINLLITKISIKQLPCCIDVYLYIKELSIISFLRINFFRSFYSNIVISMFLLSKYVFTSGYFNSYSLKYYTNLDNIISL